jgi:hypothetical protein
LPQTLDPVTGTWKVFLNGIQQAQYVLNVGPQDENPQEQKEKCLQGWEDKPKEAQEYQP